jgi:Transposase, Mutator family
LISAQPRHANIYRAHQQKPNTTTTRQSLQSGRIVSVAVIIAVGVNGDGRREVLGMDIEPSAS